MGDGVGLNVSNCGKEGVKDPVDVHKLIIFVS